MKLSACLAVLVMAVAAVSTAAFHTVAHLTTGNHRLCPERGNPRIATSTQLDVKKLPSNGVSNNNNELGSSRKDRKGPRSDTQLDMKKRLSINKSNSNDAPPLKRNPPRKVCLMVEPTPFTHVSGYANRFKEMLKFMAKAGDEVDILTVDSKTPADQLPNEAFGFRIQHTLGFTFPLYNQISLTLDLPEMKGATMLEKFKPDLIHVTSP